MFLRPVSLYLLLYFCRYSQFNKPLSLDYSFTENQFYSMRVHQYCRSVRGGASATSRLNSLSSYHRKVVQLFPSNMSDLLT